MPGQAGERQKEMTNKIKILPFHRELLNPGTKCVPAFGHDDDACLDCYAMEAFELPPFPEGSVGKAAYPVKLGFGVRMPRRTLWDVLTRKHWHAEVTGRSSQNKAGVLVMRGIVDEVYEGEIIAVLVNFNRYPVRYEKGDRICQLLFDKCRKVSGDGIRTLVKEDRKDGGFGSTGK